MIRPQIVLIALLPLSALAEQAKVNLNPALPLTSGWVAQFTLAQDLYSLGLARRDALTVVAAARLVAGLRLQQADRVPVGAGATASGVTASGAASRLPDAAAMLDQARQLAAEDDLLLGLIDDALPETASPDGARGKIGVAMVTVVTLAPGQHDTWELPFYGDANAEVAVIGDGGAELRVDVKDEGGTTICARISASDRLYCNFVPAWNGYFHVTVENRGTALASYAILTN